MQNEASWKILHLKHKNSRLMDATPVQFMELGT